MPDLTPQRAAEILRLLPGAIETAIETEQQLAILDMEGDIKTRVFLRGEDESGVQIGNYSTQPMYVSVQGAKDRYGSQLPTSKLKGRGKNSNKSKFLNGEPRKSMFFNDGYSGFRSLMGRPVDRVNLDLTGDLQNSITSGTRDNVSTIEFLGEHSAELSGWLEAKFGKTIFVANTSEIDALTERLTEAANRALEELLP